ncbi:IgG-binding virulence factor TspB family protein [Streptomyces sp. NPDC059922]|uniref:IgG-binding virulence factor TspB family protein n=1 Tax=Streptomyces sp. NPDC059922 TaxID=3347005 RepID=UPI00365D27F8
MVCASVVPVASVVRGRRRTRGIRSSDRAEPPRWTAAAYGRAKTTSPGVESVGVADVVPRALVSVPWCTSVSSKPDPESGTAAEPDREPEPDRESRTDPDSDPDSDPEPDPNPDSDPEPDPNPDSDPEPDPAPEPVADSGFSSETGSGTRPLCGYTSPSATAHPPSRSRHGPGSSPGAGSTRTSRTSTVPRSTDATVIHGPRRYAVSGPPKQSQRSSSGQCARLRDTATRPSAMTRSSGRRWLARPSASSSTTDESTGPPRGSDGVSGAACVEKASRAYSGSSECGRAGSAWSLPWLTTRTTPSARVPDTSQPGARRVRAKSPDSTGSGLSGAVHAGWPSGSSRPANPLLAQYGDAGPEYT